MRRFTRLLAAVAVFLAASSARAEEPKKAEHAGLERLKKLAGTWVAADEEGKPTENVVSVFKVTAAGSAVQETIFPGAPHEMVTLYHLDGGKLMLTHYCALGNQPKLVADPKSPKGSLKFDFVGGTNFDPAKDMHMHEGTIKFIDADTIEWSWVGYDKGEPQTDHQVDLKLIRKKD